MNAPAEVDRKRFLGSTDAAAILGLAPVITRHGKKSQRTAYTTYLAKRGELDTVMDEDTRLFLNRRKRFERPIVKMLREEYDGKILRLNRRYHDPEFPFMAAEIDFEWAEKIERRIKVQNGEIKTVHPLAFGERHGWGEPGTGDIPIHYAVQVSYGLMVTGRERAIVAALVGIDDMLFYRIERDEEFIADMRARCARFWLENVLKGVPPLAQTGADINHMMLRKTGRPCQLDDVRMTQLDRLAVVRDQLKALADEQELLSFEIGDYVCKSWDEPNPYEPPEGTVIKKRDAEGKTVEIDPLADAGLYFGGKRVASWNKQRHSHLDQKRLKADKPDIVADYMKDGTTRVLRFHKP